MATCNTSRCQHVSASYRICNVLFPSAGSNKSKESNVELPNEQQGAETDVTLSDTSNIDSNPDPKLSNSGLKSDANLPDKTVISSLDAPTIGENTLTHRGAFQDESEEDQPPQDYPSLTKSKNSSAKESKSKNQKSKTSNKGRKQAYGGCHYPGPRDDNSFCNYPADDSPSVRKKNTKGFRSKTSNRSPRNKAISAHQREAIDLGVPVMLVKEPSGQLHIHPVSSQQSHNLQTRGSAIVATKQEYTGEQIDNSTRSLNKLAVESNYQTAACLPDTYKNSSSSLRRNASPAVIAQNRSNSVVKVPSASVAQKSDTGLPKTPSSGFEPKQTSSSSLKGSRTPPILKERPCLIRRNPVGRVCKESMDRKIADATTRRSSVLDTYKVSQESLCTCRGSEASFSCTDSECPFKRETEQLIGSLADLGVEAYYPSRLCSCPEVTVNPYKFPSRIAYESEYCTCDDDDNLAAQMFQQDTGEYCTCDDDQDDEISKQLYSSEDERLEEREERKKSSLQVQPSRPIEI